MIPPDNIDVRRFERLANQGRTALAYGDPESASQICSHALALWRGPALGGVTQGDLLSAQAARLEEDRLRALETRCEANLRVGRHRELISELKELTITHPLHEGFYRQLMLALYRSDRRADALNVYQQLRRLMIDDLGLEPSTGLRQLHQALLAAESTLDAPAAVEQKAAETGRSATAATQFGSPAQLSPDIADFVGRQDAVRCGLSWLGPEQQQGNAMRVLTVTGMPGVGKTALATRVAHLVREHFPDGQLQADLRGSDRTPASPAAVLGRFLRAAGLTEQQVPADVDERTTLFRTWTAGRKVLILLDDAADLQQVRPLLPGGRTCAVVLTSRQALPGLAGARKVELGTLSAREGVELLSSLVDESLHTRPGDLELIVEMCGCLPLAIRCAGARMASTGSWPARKLAERLRPEHQRLDELRAGDLEVRPRFDTSYQKLNPRQRRTFRTLSRIEQPAFTVAQVEALLDGDGDNGELLLAQLAERNLLHVASRTNDGDVRYALHPLVRIYARERARPGPEPAERPVTVW